MFYVNLNSDSILLIFLKVAALRNQGKASDKHWFHSSDCPFEAKNTLALFKKAESASVGKQTINISIQDLLKPEENILKTALQRG